MKMSECPNCHGSLTVVAKACGECGLEVRAHFDESPIFALAREEQEFLLQFILSSGNFKAMGERLDLTYPTLRGRLDRIIAKLETAMLPGGGPATILDAVGDGTVDADEAIEQLRRMAAEGGKK